MGQLRTFEDLEVWQKSQDFAVLVYKHSSHFPKEELFALTNQLRRAATSISANIAEGFGRESIKDKLHFLAIAYGSLLESKNFLYLCQKLEYISQEILDDLLQSAITRQKLINGFRRSLKAGQS